MYTYTTQPSTLLAGGHSYTIYNDGTPCELQDFLPNVEGFVPMDEPTASLLAAAICDERNA